MPFFLDEQSESIADTLKDGSREEILEVLRTVETDCLTHKRSFEQLLELIVVHSPDLLELFTEAKPNRCGYCHCYSLLNFVSSQIKTIIIICNMFCRIEENEDDDLGWC